MLTTKMIEDTVHAQLESHGVSLSTSIVGEYGMYETITMPDGKRREFVRNIARNVMQLVLGQECE